MAKTVIINHVAIDNKLKRLVDNDVRLFSQQELYRALKKFVPVDTGVTAENVQVTTEGVTFISPNARFLYHGKLMVSPTTGSAWAKQGEKKVLTDKDLNFSAEKNPYATSFWDKHIDAEALAGAIEDYIRRNKTGGG